jgi:hypothetical protein
MRLIPSLAVLLALATPANARFWTVWRCGEVAVELVDNQERKTLRALPGKTLGLTPRLLDYYVQRHKAHCPRPAGV